MLASLARIADRSRRRRVLMSNPPLAPDLEEWEGVLRQDLASNSDAFGGLTVPWQGADMNEPLGRIAKALRPGRGLIMIERGQCVDK